MTNLGDNTTINSQTPFNGGQSRGVALDEIVKETLSVLFYAITTFQESNTLI